MKTTDLFNFFHDELKEVIEDTEGYEMELREYIK